MDNSWEQEDDNFSYHNNIWEVTYDNKRDAANNVVFHYWKNITEQSEKSAEPGVAIEDKVGVFYTHSNKWKWSSITDISRILTI
jgi:hypothetical protein